MELGKCWYRCLIIPLIVLTLAFMGCDDGDDGEQGPPGPPGPPGTQGTIIGQWEDSGHADATAEAFTHWDEDGEVEIECARCHSKQGFLDYAEDGITDMAAPTGSVISCAACHSSTLFDDFEGDEDFESVGTGAAIKDGVAFPSGAVVSLGGPSNICMVCHQGRASTVDVNNAIADEDFGFINIHYYAAAATLFGTEVQGGYEYDGKDYVGRFTHVPSFDTCVDCHMGPSQINHTMEPEVEYCVDCHTELESPSDMEDPFRSIRRDTTVTDYDGDGDAEEGIYFEINDTLVPALLTEIQDYASAVIGTDIAYSPTSYPYWFVDTNGNGEADEDEANFGNRFADFDAELLRAAYNYQVTQKEPCGYIHNARYIIQLIYDSIEALGGDVADFTRPAEAGATGVVGEWMQSGHADVTAEAFNHWNEDGGFLGDDTECAQCHNPEGFRDYAQDGTVDNEYPIGEDDLVTETIDETEVTHVTQDFTLTCQTCHLREGEIAATVDPSTLYSSEDFQALEPVTFPSGATATFNGPSNICASCHQGRESGVDVQEAIDEADTHSFINRHYFAAAAILFGSEVTAAYEYPEQNYLGQNTYPGHGDSLSNCVDCHMRSGQADHNFSPLISDCNGCHQNVTDNFEQLGLPFGQADVDYDGDGTGESFQGEIDGFLEGLLSAMQTYADGNADLDSIGYSAGSYPYFFIDTDGSGVIEEGEAEFANRYTTFDDALLAAAYNYHSGQDPCNDMHHYRYTIQALYDSIDDLNDGELNGNVNFNANAAMRPEGGTGGNQAPQATATSSPADPDVGTEVTLTATATDADNDQADLTFSWTLEAPDGSDATSMLTGADMATATFTPDVEGTWSATVTVTDPEGASDQAAAAVAVGGVAPTQPDVIVFENGVGDITFSHTGHVADLGACTACHSEDPTELEVDNTGQAAAHAFCGECHQQEVSTSCSFCHGN